MGALADEFGEHAGGIGDDFRSATDAGHDHWQSASEGFQNNVGHAFHVAGQTKQIARRD